MSAYGETVWYKPGDKLLMSSVKQNGKLKDESVTVLSFEDISEGYQITDIRMLVEWGNNKASFIKTGSNYYEWRNHKSQKKYGTVEFEKEQPNVEPTT